MIKRNMFVLAVQDLTDSANYYKTVLGFTIREIGDDGWRLFERDSCQIMAGHCPDAMPAQDLGDHSYFAYLVVESADRYYDEVVEQGADVTKPIRSEPWGMREFCIRTIDGHRIMIGEDLDG
ncbi:MAG: VOC family protein [Burkholderiaceae bacterium]